MLSKIKAQRLLSLTVGLLFIITGSCQVNTSNSDWSEFLGKNQASTWELDLHFDTLIQSRIEKLWEQQIGSGYSGPTTIDSYVVVMDLIKENNVQKERILCLDTETGKEIWSYSYSCEYSVGYPTGPRSSVTLEDGRAYAFGTMGHLHCFDLQNGKLLWSVNGQKHYQIDFPIWGLAASPIIEGDLLIVQMGGKPGACYVAFDKLSGSEVWRSINDDASYVTPVTIEQAGKRVMLVWTGQNFIGINPGSGQEYWSIPFQQSKSIINITSPIIKWPYVFLTCFYDGSMLVKLEEKSLDAELIWKRKGESERKTDALHAVMTRPFIQGEYIYGIDSYGEFRCLELMTGNRIWVDSTLTPYGRWSNAHMVKQADQFWAFNETGELVLGEVSPKGFIDLGRVKLLETARMSPNPRGGVNWAHPAFSGRRIYARSDAKIVCYELK